MGDDKYAGEKEESAVEEFWICFCRNLDRKNCVRNIANNLTIRNLRLLRGDGVHSKPDAFQDAVVMSTTYYRNKSYYVIYKEKPEQRKNNYN